MTLLPSLITLQSFFFVLSIWLVPSRSLAQSPESATGSCVNVEVAAALILSRKWVEQEDLEAAEACLTLAMRRHPRDRSIVYQRIRVIAFQGKWSEVKRLSPYLTGEDAETWELRGDLAWYQGQGAEAERFYINASQASPDGLVSKELLEKIQRAARRDQKSRATFRAGLDGTRIRQSQSVHLDESHAIFHLNLSRTSYKLEGLRVVRKTPEVQLHDESLSLAVAHNWNASHSSEISYGQTLGAIDFSYQEMLALKHEFQFMQKIYSGLEATWQSFRQSTGRRLSVYAGIYEGLFHGHIKIYKPMVEADDYAVLIKNQLFIGNFIPELWAAVGHGEASRSYLTREQRAKFQTFGLKIGFRLFSELEIFAATESRSEQHFSQNLWTLGAVWGN